ncbi:GntR family transcriptional regulator [Nocardiopsis sp. CT-R113]|uniref:GntR family transcriptional regulator n=1 Tax=Nocardiopsis codii TaxID=3065942 RepID=A0ABU7KFA2_9ACTN|nr:GntR family transcriptional regulator [Nocardiopsis sp. CT-R113]MEE2040918.1 GntR family transcriptional regulator [Nocardiopsis sp. CT-R113]
MSDDLQRPAPPYMQIADHFRTLISTGTLRQGDRLPTIAQLTERYKVSPGTAAKAMRQLRGEALIDTRQQGSVVVGGMRAVPEPAERAQRGVTFDTGDETTMTEVGVVPMLPSVGAALGIDADGLNRTVVRREAITARDGSPYRLSVTWAHPEFTDAAPELLEPTPLNVIMLISERSDRTATAGRDYYEARTADEREAAALHIEVGTPVLAGTAVWRDDVGPIAYYEYVVPPRHAVSSDYSLLPSRI